MSGDLKAPEPRKGAHLEGGSTENICPRVRAFDTDIPLRC